MTSVSRATVGQSRQSGDADADEFVDPTTAAPDPTDTDAGRLDGGVGSSVSPKSQSADTPNSKQRRYTKEAFGSRPRK